MAAVNHDRIYNKLLKEVTGHEGKVQKFSLAFGESDDDRFMVATEDIKVDVTIMFQLMLILEFLYLITKIMNKFMI